ncbi:UDP-N-acetylglucosamine 2-epimerase [Salinirubellus sp. GCM10025818]|uniref:UDP-N-acetylglucosamine 2-epimerase n=1 Tax=Salinirubellus TaxID=2162630 RepID=UPI0030CAF7E8
MNGADDRRVLVLTGTRAEYGLLRSSMAAIRDREGLALQVVATGMHLSPRHGRTVEEIREDGFAVDREVLMQVEGDTGKAMAKSLGLGTSGLAEAFASLDPDVVLLLGDRDEALAGALAAAHMNVPVAHVHGGDSMHGAIIDDSIRHAITKFAHLHFPVSELSAERVERLGEEPRRVTTVGAPGLDDVLAGEYDDPASVLERHGLDPGEPLLLVVQHPVTTRPEEAGEQIAATLDAVESFDAQAVVIYPNSDAGGDRMIDEIESRGFDGRVGTFRSLPRREYLGVMAAADAMVGNSSSGVIEAPSFSLPVVDVGPRQEGRERAANTLSVPHETDAIRAAIERCLTDETFRERVCECENPYDYGGAGERICERLAEVELGEELLRKRLTY